MNGGLYAVAGATGAMGRALCRHIKQAGGTPLLIGRSSEKLQQLNEELQGGCPMVSECDFERLEETSKVLTAAFKEHPSLNGLVYAVGSITLKSIKGCKLDDFRKSYELNVLGAINLIQVALPSLKKGATTTTVAAISPSSSSSPSPSPSSIVLFSSIAALRGLPSHAIISCSKSALQGLTLALSAELAPHVRVNCVAPSLTAGSAMAKPLTENEKVAQAVTQAHAMARLGRPEDAAAAAAYLLSRDSGWVTGTVLSVDGGRAAVLK